MFCDERWRVLQRCFKPGTNDATWEAIDAHNAFKARWTESVDKGGCGLLGKIDVIAVGVLWPCIGERCFLRV